MSEEDASRVRAAGPGEEIVLNSLPYCVWVEIEDCDYKHPDKPKGWVPIVPVKDSLDGIIKNRRVLCTQIPLVEGFAMTGLCIQGKTAKTQHIGDFTKPTHKWDRAQIPVALSRVTGALRYLAGFFNRCASSAGAFGHVARVPST